MTTKMIMDRGYHHVNVPFGTVCEVQPMPRKPGDPELTKRIGLQIRALRDEAKMTQEALAWSCDLAKGYLSYIESGKRLPSIEALSRIARVLEVELMDLIAYDMTSPRVRLFVATRKMTAKELAKLAAQATRR